MRAARLALALALLAARAERDGPVWNGVRFPPGRVGDALSALPSDPPLPLPAPWPPWSDRSSAAWGGDAPWHRWVELVRAESQARAPERRAALAMLARLQGRDADGWNHLLAAAERPGLAAALLPLFAPGLAPDELAPGAALPDGVVLRPALPPSDDPRGALRFLAGSRLECLDLAVGEARCSIAVSVDRDGLEVAARHLAGGPARVSLSPPLPGGVDPGLLFADWEKRPGELGPVEFLLTSEDPEHSLWLTFHPPSARWPDPPPELVGDGAAARRIVLVSARGDEPHLSRFAGALGELLGVPAELRAAGAGLPDGLEPLVVDLDGSPAAERKLVDLLGQAEAFLLRGAGR